MNMVRNRGYLYVGLIAVLLITMLLGGCGPSNKEIVSQYRQSVRPILSDLAQEGEKWDKLRQKSSSGQITDFQFAVTVQNDLSPKLVNLQARMEAIEADKNLRAIHEIGIKMISKNLQAMNEVVGAVYAGDMSKIASANNLLTEARELERKYANQLDDFAK